MSNVFNEFNRDPFTLLPIGTVPVTIKTASICPTKSCGPGTLPSPQLTPFRKYLHQIREYLFTEFYFCIFHDRQIFSAINYLVRLKRQKTSSLTRVANCA